MNKVQKGFIKTLIAHNIELDVTPKILREQCAHWSTRKNNKLSPSVSKDDNEQNNWRCNFCGASFPIRPVDLEKRIQTYNDFLEQLNQLQFYSVKLGDDIGQHKELFSTLKKFLPQYLELQGAVINAVNKRMLYQEKLERSNDKINMNIQYSASELTTPGETSLQLLESKDNNDQTDEMTQTYFKSIIDKYPGFSYFLAKVRHERDISLIAKYITKLPDQFKNSLIFNFQLISKENAYLLYSQLLRASAILSEDGPFDETRIALQTKIQNILLEISNIYDRVSESYESSDEEKEIPVKTPEESDYDHFLQLLSSIYKSVDDGIFPIAKYLSKLSEENKTLIKNDLLEVMNKRKIDSFKTINDYPKRELTVADFVNHVDGNFQIRILDANLKEIYFDHVYDEISEFYERVVDNFNISPEWNFGVITLQLKAIDSK